MGTYLGLPGIVQALKGSSNEAKSERSCDFRNGTHGPSLSPIRFGGLRRGVQPVMLESVRADRSHVRDPPAIDCSLDRIRMATVNLVLNLVAPRQVTDKKEQCPQIAHKGSLLDIALRETCWGVRSCNATYQRVQHPRAVGRGFEDVQQVLRNYSSILLTSIDNVMPRASAICPSDRSDGDFKPRSICEI